MATTTYVHGILLCVSLLFATIGLHVLTDPAGALATHGMEMTDQPASAFAEIRAFYFGTMGMLSVIFLRGGIPSSSLKDRQEALGVLLGVLTLFVLGRLVSYVVDGPASLAYSDVMWGAEAGGACAAAALLLYGTHEHMA